MFGKAAQYGSIAVDSTEAQFRRVAYSNSSVAILEAGAQTDSRLYGRRSPSTTPDMKRFAAGQSVIISPSRATGH